MVRVIAFTLLLCGCFTAGASFQRYGIERASFDLQCPKESLKVIALDGSLDDQAQSGNHVGVSGCNRHAVYINTDEGGWILDGSGTDSSDARSAQTP